MFSKILLCFDGSVGARRGAEAVLKLATEQEAFVQLLSVIERLPHYSATMGETDEEFERASAYFREGQNAILEHAAQLGVIIEAKTMPGNAPQVIVHTAEEGGFDLVAATLGMTRRVGCATI